MKIQKSELLSALETVAWDYEGGHYLSVATCPICALFKPEEEAMPKCSECLFSNDWEDKCSITSPTQQKA